MLLTETRPMSRWHALAERVLAGDTPLFDEALAVLTAPDEELLELLAAAYRIRSHHFGNTVKLNYLINAKSGLCAEDCSYCSQSRISTAPIDRYPMLQEDEMVAQAEHAVSLKATTCCIVTSGRRPTMRELTHVAGVVRTIKGRHPNLRLCVCLGMLNEEEARLLKDAGADRYNHNLNTSASHYEDICTTHTHAERVDTVQAVVQAGMSPCSGIIVGMGESLEDLVQVAYHLREIGAHSIPINTLIPVPGTPLEQGARHLNPRFCLKVLCLFRFVCPDREIRVSAGREVHFRSLQPLSLYAANSIFIGDYLTTEGQSAQMDWAMIEDLGFVIEDPEE